ncbi:MAG TPA: ABC transporter permease [Pyrinomonadaceae bacterium]|nr:ABC transporter permease [Pyrinomonadaceae bacterium]
MGTLWQDVRYGFRMLTKRPGFTVVAVISLALGIGANTAIFSVVNATLLKSLPYKDPESIVLVWGSMAAEGRNRTQVSATDVDDWRHQNGVFEDVTTYGNWSATLLGRGEPERIPGTQVGDGYFQIMGGTPLLGRVFSPEEQQEGKDFVVVLGHGLWQRRFGGDPAIVGQQVNLSGKPYTVVGVMPADFRPLPVSLVDPQGQFYRPVAEPHDEAERSSRHLRAIARLKPGVTLAAAQSEMNVIAKRLAQEHPESNSDYEVRLNTLSEDTVGGLRPTLLTLFGAVVFVLLIACANVGNLLLARSAARKKEIAVRAALGAGRVRLVRQLLTESVLLSLAGGALGLLLALWGTSLIESLGSQVTPLLSGVQIDANVLAFTLTISLLSGAVFGLAPAMQLSRPDLNEALKEGGRSGGASGSRSVLRSALVVAEVAMALVLLTGAGLLIKSTLRLRDVNPGFNAENLLTMNIALPSSKYPDKQSWVAFYERVLRGIESVPGVHSAGVTSVLPLSSNFDGRALAVEGQPRPRGEELSVDLYIATPGYLRAMEIPLVKGRALDDHDTENGQMAALVNETMARQLWPGQDPLGKRVKFPGSEKNPQPWRTVVGVVRDVKQYGLDKEDRMQLYLPEAQFAAPYMTLVVRTSSDPQGMVAAVKNEILAVDKDQAAYNVATMEQLLSDSISLRKFSMLLLLILAALALTLAAVGVYGVMAYSVAQRTHEIGIRVALGAQTRDVFRLVLMHGMAQAVAGIVIGLAGAFALTRLMSSLLFGVSATDPLTFAGVSLLLASVALLACYVPARRATKVDPMVALRYE